MKAISFVPLALLTLFLSACATNNKQADLKARPVAFSPFIENSRMMAMHRERYPFQSVWVDPHFEQSKFAYKGIMIDPVSTVYLRGVDRPLMKVTEGKLAENRPVEKTAKVTQDAFINAFQNSKKGHLKVVSQKGPDVLELQLSLTALNPTNVTLNVVRFAAPFGTVLQPLTKGNVAIEGKIRDSKTGRLLFQFADNEQDHFDYVSFKDLSHYGHARAAIRTWGKQIEEILRTPATEKVADSSSVTLNPF